ncbi:MAG: hypothetical protein HFI68_00765 [Lachnospiraceae bacterium]|nr:hypothetical protein [Lachnospiraceae bacterium]
MEKSHWYIGAPNGVVVCINRWEGHRLQGCFYHGCSEEATKFENIDQALFQLEQFFNFLNFPYATTTERTFQQKSREAEGKRERIKRMDDKELLKKHGELGTFIVRVQHRQHNSWQGRITWMEHNKTLSFRSIWEMVKLIVSAVKASDTEQEEEELSWFDDETK